MVDLISRLKRELYSKQYPSVILLSLREKWLETFLTKYPNMDIEALDLGFTLADYKLQEAISMRKINDHIRMAISYTNQIFENHTYITDLQKEIVLEIIETHHGGEHRHLESKLVKNADCMSFLEPKGFLHTFATQYDQISEDKFESALQLAMYKAEEKLSLVDLDQETMDEAKVLFEKIKWMFDRTGVKRKVPDMYRN